jgi:hypothetical protein
MSDLDISRLVEQRFHADLELFGLDRIHLCSSSAQFTFIPFVTYYSSIYNVKLHYELSDVFTGYTSQTGRKDGHFSSMDSRSKLCRPSE